MIWTVEKILILIWVVKPKFIALGIESAAHLDKLGAVNIHDNSDVELQVEQDVQTRLRELVRTHHLSCSSALRDCVPMAS